MLITHIRFIRTEMWLLKAPYETYYLPAHGIFLTPRNEFGAMSNRLFFPYLFRLLGIFCHMGWRWNFLTTFPAKTCSHAICHILLYRCAVTLQLISSLTWAHIHFFIVVVLYTRRVFYDGGCEIEFRKATAGGFVIAYW